MVFHDGLRWGIGTDWRPYLQFFENCLWAENEEFELGYKAVNVWVRSVTDKYSVFLILHAAFIYTVFYKFIKRYSPFPLMSFLILYYSMLSYLGMNRQYIAVGFCFLAVPFILKREYLKSAILICAASLFHLSALMFFVTFLLNRTFKASTLWIILLSALLISISGIINKLPLELFFFLGERANDKLEIYFTEGEAASSLFATLLGIAKRGFWLVLLLSYYSKIKTSGFSCFDFVFNVYFVALIFYILFSGTILQFIVARGLIYFNIFEIIAIPFVFVGLRKKINRQLLFILLVFLGAYTMERGMDYYKGNHVGEDIFRPYNAVYMNSDYDATGYTFED